MKRGFDIFIVVMCLAWCAACVAMVLFGVGCRVYEPAGSGRVTELDDVDGGCRWETSDAPTC